VQRPHNWAAFVGQAQWGSSPAPGALGDHDTDGQHQWNRPWRGLPLPSFAATAASPDTLPFRGCGARLPCVHMG